MTGMFRAQNLHASMGCWGPREWTTGSSPFVSNKIFVPRCTATTKEKPPHIIKKSGRSRYRYSNMNVNIYQNNHPIAWMRLRCSEKVEDILPNGGLMVIDHGSK